MKFLILIHQNRMKKDQTTDRLKREKTPKEKFSEGL